jgi:hypothetical protein
LLLFSLPGVAAAQELLKDGDLEASRADGTFPSSGYWQPAYLGQAGAICITNGLITNGLPGHCLFVYTGTPTNDFWSAPFQDAAAVPGQAFRGSARLRTPAGQPWVNGTRARVHVAFVNAETNVLTSFESAALTQASTPWTGFEVVTEVAPPETAFVRFMCLLEKPRGTVGLSAVEFDDCSLQRFSVHRVEVSSRAVGIPANLSSVPFTVQNTGNLPLSWHMEGNPSWLSVDPAQGNLATNATQPLSFNVDRTGLNGNGCVKGSVNLVSEATNLPITVYLDLPSPPPPRAPAVVRPDGRVLVVRDRLPDGSLGPSYPYVVKGAGWSPASRATPDMFSARRAEFGKWYIADIQMLREMNANTVYTFLDFGTDVTAFGVLDNLYKNGFKAIVTVDENGTGNTNNLVRVVSACRDHPAILGWSIGNEWNINYYHDRFTNTYDGYLAAAAFTELMAHLIKTLDTNHPVVSTHGDIYPPDMDTLVNQLCPSVDIWGLNVYRGVSFTTLFADWPTFTTKPMFLSEFGTDAYRTLMTKTELDLVSVDGAVDEVTQAEWNRGLWREIAANLSALNPGKVCLGGSVFEWNDEWWKAQAAWGGEVGRQDNLGFYLSWNPMGHPDTVANEEWFGQVSIDRNPRLSYAYFQKDFAALPDPAMHLTVSRSLLTSEVTLHWSPAPGRDYEVQCTETLPSAAWTAVSGSVVISGSDAEFVDNTASVSTQKFYRLLAKPNAGP